MRFFPVFLAILLFPAVCLGAAQSVLVVYSNNRLLPANIEIDRGMREVFAANPARAVELFVEFLDAPAFSGPDYEGVISNYLREKYSARPPKVVVFVGYNAFQFMTRQGQLFPGVPRLHVAVDRAQIARLPPLAPHVAGTPVDYDYAGTIRLALRLHPRTRRLVVITGASNRDLEWRRDVRAALEQVQNLPEVEHIEGLPTPQVEQRVAALPPTAVVFTPGYYRDGADNPYAPREAAERIAKASAVPVYGPYSTFIGKGIVGGSMPTYLDMGHQAATSVNALLDGTPPSALALPDRLPAIVQLDARQLQRWKIDEALVPAGAQLHFRQPTFWEAYRYQAMGVAVVIAVQGLLIVALLLQRRARQRTATALAASEARMSLAAGAARLSHWTWDVEPDTAGRTPSGSAIPFEQVLRGVHAPDRDALTRAVRLAVRMGNELDIEYRTAGPGSEVRWLAVRGRRTDGASGRMAGVALDITERKLALLQAEGDRMALKHLTRVATMGELSASIAHQLNQPLAAILGNAEVLGKLLARDTTDRAELQEICSDIIAEDKRASEIIRRLGALYRRGELRVTRFDLNELVVETLALLNSELLGRQVAAETDLASSLPAVEGEPLQLQQVLMNLVLNSADAMSGIDPAARRVTIRTELHGEQVRMAVSDRGPGIAPENLERIFDAFWSTKGNGLGMGLAICQSILKAHRGTLVATNNADAGATFLATWPREAP